MTLIYLLAGVLGGSIALVGVLDLIKRIRQLVRRYRVGRELQAIEKDAYRYRPGGRAHVQRGMSRSEWEGDSENS